MSNPVIQYTSRTYNTALADINTVSYLIDKPDWWKKLWAGIMDVASICMNAEANQAYLSTAFTEEAVDRLLELIDYERTAPTTSSGSVLFHVSPLATFPFTVTAANLVAYSQGSLSVTSKRFEAIAAATFSASSETFTASDTTDKLTVARVYATGEKVILSSTTTLPAPFQPLTEYYAIYVDATHIRLAYTQETAYTGAYIDITDTGTGTHTIKLYSKSVTVYQQETIASQVVGTSDGSTAWQEFDLPDLNILSSSIVVTINSVTWTKVTTFVYSTASDTHYKLIYKTDGSAYILFGDGTYGAIPAAFAIYVVYAVGGGSESNVSSQNYINSYGGADTNLSGVTNTLTLTGGADRQSMTVAKRVGPMLLKTRDRFITVDDGEALVLGYGGVSRCIINPNVYGLLSAQVVIVPNGGGSPSGALKSALDTYLTDRAIPGIDVRVIDPTYITTAITIAVKVESGYTFGNIQDYCELACLLFISEKTYEVYLEYYDNGIADAVTWINTTWSYSFTSADYAQIIKLLDAVEPVDFGQTVRVSNLNAFVDQYVDGVDYLTISAPAADITLAVTEITHEGAITVTSI